MVRFTVQQCDEVRQIALLSAPGGELLLLAGESAGDLSVLLTPVYDQPKPGQSHYFSRGPSLVRQRIEPLMGDALHHIDQIIETRTVHNR